MWQGRRCPPGPEAVGVAVGEHRAVIGELAQRQDHHRRQRTRGDVARPDVVVAITVLLANFAERCDPALGQPVKPALIEQHASVGLAERGGAPPVVRDRRGNGRVARIQACAQQLLDHQPPPRLRDPIEPNDQTVCGQISRPVGNGAEIPYVVAKAHDRRLEPVRLGEPDQHIQIVIERGRARRLGERREAHAVCAASGRCNTSPSASASARSRVPALNCGRISSTITRWAGP